MNHVEVANSILNQLGGNQFTSMTGAKYFIALDEQLGALRFHLGKNASKANRVKITLQWDDTYLVEFIKYTSYKYNIRTGKETQEKSEVLKSIDKVYCDTLREVFEDYTKMYTRLW